MNSFDLLHPVLQHHIVNSLGWRELRPFQEDVIPPILDGKHIVVLAPTAGGKTEAALFPVLSRMLAEEWRGLSVLYVCPIKALLNNLELRLERYGALLGRRSAFWHGDVVPSRRRKIMQDPPDILLTTPESLEVMLVSKHVDRETMFRDVRVVVVDEIHAFAGDDRGWHLLSVLERITRIAGRELQRIGLSATVGNPEELLTWLTGSCDGFSEVHVPSGAGPDRADVKLDYVGSLSNAATVISRLHRGEKRLVFLDSRARVEELASHLREREVRTFVTHSSLSRDQREQAEEAFSGQENCVIVATSVLELGVDVGDLDRVIQIDAPSTVSAFLQRMGRTGRRSGSSRNCLFLATDEEDLLHAAGLIDLWASGFVEPVVPPPMPLHVFAQQLMALVLQEDELGRRDWPRFLGRMPAFKGMDPAMLEEALAHMVETGTLFDEAGILGFGEKGEKEFGRRNFMDILSVITGEPLFTVRHGRTDLGYVHPISFVPGNRSRPTLLLAGRSWGLTHLDWKEKVAYVEPSRERGKSRWMGDSRPLSHALCQSIRRVLAGDDQPSLWSNRAQEKMTALRQDAPWASMDHSSLVFDGASWEWWTFGGILANATLAHELSARLERPVDVTNLSLVIEGELGIEELETHIKQLRELDPRSFEPPVLDEMLKKLKFSSCLPHARARELLARRMADLDGVKSVVGERVLVSFIARDGDSM